MGVARDSPAARTSEPAARGRQKLKSAYTRTAILEAAVDCILERGYSGLTLQAISNRTSLSRSAITHQFRCKNDLTIAVFDYVFAKRMEVYVAAVRQLSKGERVMDSHGIDVFWSIRTHREYSAYFRLRVEARTDRELGRLFLPRARQFEQMARGTTRELFPEWAEFTQIELVADLISAVLDGLVLNAVIWDSSQRAKSVRTLMATVVVMLSKGLLTVPPVRAPSAPGQSRHV